MTIHPPASPPSGYNILLVVVDQERHFGRYPFPVPARERLIREGTSFNRHQNCSNVCTSSRSVLYTGWHMPVTGMFDNFGLPWMTNDLDPALGTLGSMMRQAGYYAVYKGKWHLTAAFEGGIHTEPRLAQVMERYGFSDYHGIGDAIGWSQGGYLYDEIIAAQTVNWLRGTGQSLRRAGRNWFLALNLVNPHDVMFIDTDRPDEQVQWTGAINEGGVSMNPAQPPENELYKAEWADVPLPANRHQRFDEPGRPQAHAEYQRARAALVGDFADEDRRWRKLQDYYFNCIRDSDRHVQRVLDELDSLGLTESTIVVFTSDHGELGGSHGMHGKGSSVYREQINVPMIVAHPAYPGGSACEALTCHLDVAPTLLALTGLAAEQRDAILGKRQGVDFSPLLSQPEAAPVDAIREDSLYCFSMFTYADGDYLGKVQAIRRSDALTAEGKQLAIGKVPMDLTKRSGIRCLYDGRYKFARYFSLRQHNLPETVEALTSYNDLELFDTVEDPGELRNLAADGDANLDLIEALNAKLNAIIAREIGRDDGSFLPMSGLQSWDVRLVIE
ncbi:MULTISPECIES: sulfatase-like hydrolase/transferase [Sphingomonas]|uniref:sulfatase-like hydrolase/transferase n=1 Tax=Sphingomonas TaxID=13687 RepID=UPI000F7E81E5|nr:sulfatase-like hydrolase/transferase [Sphingomonas sp. ABOLF]RSV14246.1 phosphatase [Sphingomonas sp. ABOLF]